jgi:adenine-specific DNA-methyltransferase
VNRMILGDSLIVMNSLLEYEGLGGQVQMIYIDPPYGVKFGSNFQPFVRRRNVTNGDDADMTREPEMVKAYRDTWELGLHSYLTYLRDRALVARDLLTPSGSVFLQISDENVNVVRDLLDEVFGRENFVSTIVVQKTSSEEGEGIANLADYLLWYARDLTKLKSHPLLKEKRPGEPGARQYTKARSTKTGEIRDLDPAELVRPEEIGDEWRVCRVGYPLTSQDPSTNRTVPFVFEGKEYWPGGARRNRHWSVDPEVAMPNLVKQGRIYATRDSIQGIVYLDELPGSELGNIWLDTGTGSFTQEQLYVVQTSEKVIERCILLATDAGDLVLDPTCGSGTSAYAAEKWGRRWITIDTSRVPLALARQRMLTATFPYFRLIDGSRGPASGLQYESPERSRNRRADGVGVRYQHTLSSIAGEAPHRKLCFAIVPRLITRSRVSLVRYALRQRSPHHWI